MRLSSWECVLWFTPTDKELEMLPTGDSWTKVSREPLQTSGMIAEGWHFSKNTLKDSGSCLLQLVHNCHSCWSQSLEWRWITQPHLVTVDATVAQLWRQMVHLKFTMLWSPLCCSQKSDSDPESSSPAPNPAYNSSEELLACFPLSETRCLKLLKRKPSLKVQNNLLCGKKAQVLVLKIWIH